MIHLFNKNKLAWRIKVTFAGKLTPKEYITPDIRNNDPGWGGELFNRAIEKLEFYIPTGHKIILSGMEQYNFFIEATQDMGGRGSGKVCIDAFWFCGKLPGKNIVEMWKVGNNKVVRMQKPFGHEYGDGPTRGWKTGIPGEYLSQLVNI
jgi:hypothetical protein